MQKTFSIVVLVFLFTFGNFAQTQKGLKQEKIKSIPGVIKVESVNEFSALFSYDLKSQNLALFVSDVSNPEGQIVVREKNILGNDTIIYPSLRKNEKVGRFIARGFAKNNGRFLIDGLVSQQDYFLHFYVPKFEDNDTLIYVSSFSFNTLALKPKQSAYQIAFEDITHNSFSVTWVNGDGNGRIVIVAKGDKLPLPENGKAYRVSASYGKDIARLGSGFVVYDGKDARPKIVVTNLEPATKYIVGVIEYNGEGKYRNYNTSFTVTNLRSITTKLPYPKIKIIENVTQSGCLLRWDKVNGASTYILELATDKEFNQKVEPYVELDIGDLGEFELSDLKPKTLYYVRLKAKGEAGESLYSPIFEFKTK